MYLLLQIIQYKKIYGGYLYLSIFKNHFPSGKINYAYSLDEIVKYYNLYYDLMDYWRKLLPNFIFDIKYENLISNTKNEINDLLEFCNLNSKYALCIW